MSLWTTLDRAQHASGDEINLRQRGDIFEIRYNGIELMSNLNHRSEDQLALRSLRLGDFSARSVLIGGLGLGFTLRAVLDHLGAGAEVTVCELIPEVITWNRGPLAPLADHALADPRVRLVQGDVRAHLAAASGSYDLILMDTDNGPDFTVRPDNAALYGATGIALVTAALRPGGIAAFWSATISPEFEGALARQPWAWMREDIALLPGRVDALHHIYYCARDAARLGLRAAG